MLQRLEGDRNDQATTLGTARCPRCGLCMEISDCGGQAQFSYDYGAWDRRCRSPMLGGPSVCLMLASARASDDAGRRVSLRPSTLL